MNTNANPIRVVVKYQGILGCVSDFLMTPIMRLLSGRAFFESPQRTHFWNNKKFPRDFFGENFPNQSMTVFGERDTGAIEKGKVLFHVPILGGWTKYFVIEPMENVPTWQIGWKTNWGIGISRIPIKGKVRVLRGSSDAIFFGLNQEGAQITIKIVGKGDVGGGGAFSQILLL